MRRHIFTLALWSGETVLGAALPLPIELWVVTFVAASALTAWLYREQIGGRRSTPRESASRDADSARRWEPTHEEYLRLTWEDVASWPEGVNDRRAEQVTVEEFSSMSPEEAYKLPDHVYDRLDAISYAAAVEEYRDATR